MPSTTFIILILSSKPDVGLRFIHLHFMNLCRVILNCWWWWQRGLLSRQSGHRVNKIKLCASLGIPLKRHVNIWDEWTRLFKISRRAKQAIWLIKDILMCWRMAIYFFWQRYIDIVKVYSELSPCLYWFFPLWE